ncbi:MAG TPA: amidohydrolase family protein, partial [Pseudonocardia sp.]
IIDTDTHLTEPPDLWTSRMSKKWGDLVPHVKWNDEKQSEYWYVGDQPIMGITIGVVNNGPNGEAVIREDEFPNMPKVWGDVHPSQYDPVERAKAMDEVGLTMAALYPNLGFVGPDIYHVAKEQTLEFQTEAIRAYNDFQMEWNAAAPGRFITLAAIPYWSVEESVREIERAVESGHKGLVTTGMPQMHGQPYLADKHWDPIWSAASEAGLPISFHAGGGDFSRHWNEQRFAVEGFSAMTARAPVCFFFDNATQLADLLFSGVLPRFPDLKFVSVESGIGWIPFCLEACDTHYKKYAVQKERPEFGDLLPSDYFHRQVYANYWFEEVNLPVMAAVGTDNILFETDYPHPTCLFQREVTDAVAKLDRVDPDLRDKILWRNAARLYSLDVSTLADPRPAAASRAG